jgi:hypothetical protein
VIERLLETWLNRANERSFQVPFAHWLALTGHTVIHLSRHCAMELGKDIITIAPDGVPCAYQLKGVSGERLSLSKWRADLSKQLHPLVHLRLVHPSLPPHRYHRSYIVVNGDLYEEVQREIDDFNRANVEAGQPERIVETIVKGQLFQAFKELQSNFWATNLHDLKSYLEFFLEDGRGCLPKEKLAKLFLDALPLDPQTDRKPGKEECARALAGCAVICASAISPWTLAENHVAEFEAWTLFWCYALALVDRWGLGIEDVASAVDLAANAAKTSLARLCDELITREEFTEGDPLIDRPIFDVRMTHLLGVMGLYGLILQRQLNIGQGGEDEYRHLNATQGFCDKHRKRLWLWGEYAIPQFLAWNFFRKTYDATLSTDIVYAGLIDGISQKNRPGSENTLANPYYDAEAIMPHLFGLAARPLDDAFDGKSFYLEGLMHLFVRSGLKQELKWRFPEITRIAFCSYRPESSWQLYLFKNWNRGDVIERFLIPPHRWSELTCEAKESSGTDLPVRLRSDPLGYLGMLLVIPHRVTASGLRWLATQIDEQANNKTWFWAREARDRQEAK